MKMKKSLLSVFLIVLTFVFVLAGCSSSKQSSAGSSGSGSGSGSSSGSGSGSSSSSSSVSKVSLWDISTGVEQKIVKSEVSSFNSSQNKVQVNAQFFENDPYKQKLQMAMGANKAPDIFYNWGGGKLKDYVDAGKIVDLTSAFNSDPKLKNKFLPSVMKGVTFNGKIYGVPMNKIQPVSFNYNKDIFNKYNITPPKTWNDLLSDIKILKSHNIAPIALAGKNEWPDLMFEEYLVDRIGGPQVFKDVIANKPNAWSNPAFIKANKMIQQLVDAGAFESGFSSVGFSSGESDALVYTGKAAMQLMGAWDFSNVLSSSPSYINNKKFGYFAFPAVSGGKGDPNDIAGNLSTYYSVTKTAKDKNAAIQYLKNGVLDDKAIQSYINAGDVPPVTGIESKLKGNKYSSWLMFNYNLVKNAPNFQMSWDQALSAKEAQQMLDDLSKVFLKKMTPQQFSNDMNKYIGQ